MAATALTLTITSCSFDTEGADPGPVHVPGEDTAGSDANPPQERTDAERGSADAAVDAPAPSGARPPVSVEGPPLTVPPCEPEAGTGCSQPADPNTFEDVGQAQWLDVADAPTSTFGLDVDTASYRVSVAMADARQTPPPESVRIEEWVNAFDYADPAPTETNLGLTVESAPAPRGADGAHLVRIGVAAADVAEEDRPPVSVTLVVDVSGSMQDADKLDLVRRSLAMMTENLRPDDTVAVVTYADGSEVALPPTPMSESSAIVGALDDLSSGGSTSVEDGLRLGYEVAAEGRRDGATDIVLLASDGVANNGITDPDALVDEISAEREDGISLVTAGFGMNGLNDTLMEQLSRTGDGFYAYIDSEEQAERFFVDDLASTLVPMARDAKIQVSFDDTQVESYRLLGYQNRALEEEDFLDDTVDAGELGAGHRVSALYEVVPAEGADGDLGQVALRWADPGSGEVSELTESLGSPTQQPADESLRLAALVADSAGLMRGDPELDERGVTLDSLAAEAADLGVDGVEGAADLGLLLQRFEALGGPAAPSSEDERTDDGAGAED